MQERFRKNYEETGALALPQNPNYLEQRHARRDEGLCDGEPPEAQVFGLLQDILLSFQACGEDMQQLCGDARMNLLEINPALIASEAALRISEESGGNKCKFCQEFVFANQPCRFC